MAGEGIQDVITRFRTLSAAPVAYTPKGTPIPFVGGGAEDDTDFDTEIGTEGDDESRVRTRDDEDDELEDLSREELYAKLKGANDTAKKYRLRLKRARSGDRTSDRDSSRRTRDSRRDDGDEAEADRRDDRRNRGRDDDRDSRREDRRRDRDDDRDSRESEDRAIRAEAKVALAAAGISADRLNRAVRLIDTRSLELDGDDLLGIEDEIEDLKDEWPELFEKKRSRDDEDDERDTRRRRIPRADVRSGGGRSGRDSGRKELTASEKQAKMLQGFASQL